MLYQDRKSQFDNQLAFTEYLASFWNPEAVKKVQEIRASANQHKFKSDQEFEEEVLSGNYKDNHLLDAVKRIKELEQKEMVKVSKNKSQPRSRLPTDLSMLHSSIARKFK